MFVSANAVQGFFALAPPLRRPARLGARPGHARCLAAAGVPPERIDTPAEDAGSSIRKASGSRSAAS
jgi:hypothetical protein